MKMGRIGDGDVHAAYVEFRAKESDKVNYPFPAIDTSIFSATVIKYQITVLMMPSVSLSAMHLLSVRTRQKHLPTAPTPP